MIKELDNLYNGLLNSNILLIKDDDNALECSFLKGGIVHQIVKVKDQVLVVALRCVVTNRGILEGDQYHFFRNTFDNFSLHVKAGKLYLDLRFSIDAAAAIKEEMAAA